LIGQKNQSIRSFDAALAGFEFCQSTERLIMNKPISIFTAPELLQIQRGVWILPAQEMDTYSLGVLMHFLLA
jgi:hypothetical protein